MRELHLANIANVAYGYAKIQREAGRAADVLCYDLAHILSMPEWAEGDFDIAIEDEWRPPLDHPEVRRVTPPGWYRRIRSQDYWIPEGTHGDARFSAEWADTIVRASERFGPRWAIGRQDVMAYKLLIEALQVHFFGGYDIALGYAYGAVPPLLAATVPYVAVEIGTLRDTVNVDTPLGRLLALAYRTAPWTIITNADCRSAAETLELQNYSYVPHPVDEDVFRPLAGEERRALRASMCASAHLLIAPARQSWVVKANDRYLRAFAELVRGGTDATLLVSEWGPDIARSRELIAALGIADRVKWFAPAPERRLARMLAAADLVLDQFGTFGTFGLIAPKAMACGTPCALSFDARLHAWCFEEIPPLLPAREEHQILQAMRQHLTNEEERQRAGARSRAWVLAHHSKATIARKMRVIVEAVTDSKRPRAGFDALREQRIALQSRSIPVAPPVTASTPEASALSRVVRRVRHIGARLVETARALRHLQGDRSRLATTEGELNRHVARLIELDGGHAALTSRLDAALPRLDELAGRHAAFTSRIDAASLQVDELAGRHAALTSRLDTALLRVDGLADRHAALTSRLATALLRVDELAGRDAALTSRLESALLRLDELAGCHAALEGQTSRQSVRLEDTVTKLGGLTPRLEDAVTRAGALASRLDELASLEGELRGLASRLDGVAAQEAQLQKALMGSFELMGKNRLEDRDVITRTRAGLLEAMLRSRLAPLRLDAQPTSRPRLLQPLSLDEARNRLRAAAPLNWPLYVECLDRGTASYARFPPGSCSTSAHPQAELFRAFLRPYLRGPVLDVGCGPQPVPWYLSDYDTQWISGIDPISDAQQHPFSFVSGFGEFLPWEDGAFDVVISGTSVDHYYLLDRGLQEAFRVLRPRGHFVAWIAEFAGAPPYEPYGSRMTAPYDDEHLFHIDRAWFLPLMARTGFVAQEVLHLELPFHQLFMSFEKPGHVGGMTHRVPA